MLVTAAEWTTTNIGDAVVGRRPALLPPITSEVSPRAFIACMASIKP
jgi:hypothetical protein